MTAHQKGKLEESFGTGTAAAVSPIGELLFEGQVMKINEGRTGPMTNKLYETIVDIQYGHAKDLREWTIQVVEEAA